MAKDILNLHHLFLIIIAVSAVCVTAIVNVDRCGHLSTVQPTLLGRNVTFIFTPSRYDTDARLQWQRLEQGNKENYTWATLPENNKFIQFEEGGIFYLILTYTEPSDDKLYYRIQYNKDNVNCIMETPRLKLRDISGENCGYVYLRTTKIVDGEKVEIEYYPTETIINNPDDNVREWVRFTDQSITTLSIDFTGEYNERSVAHNKYVFTIVSYNASMDGSYAVRCASRGFFSNTVNTKLQVAPSAPMFENLRNIEDCTNCIVGEADVQFHVICRITGGTEPITVTMAIGNESLNVLNDRKNGGYMAFFILKNKYHLAVINCSVKNDAVNSPLTVTAPVYVIKTPILQSFAVPTVLREGDPVNITCSFASGRPAPTLSLNIADVKLSSVKQTNTINNTNQSYTSFIALHAFKKTWNGQNISCCRHSDWYTEETKCVTSQRVKYLFPPSRVEVQMKENETDPSVLYVVCSIYDSNPVCKAKWSAPTGSIYSERSSKIMSNPSSAWNSETIVEVNTSKRYNDDMVVCSPACSEFTPAINKSVLLPFAPVTEFNISGSKLEVSKGSEVYVKCIARSNPKSSISWIEYSSISDNVTIEKLKQCDQDTECIIAIHGDRTMQRNLHCKSENFLGASSEKLTISIVDQKTGSVKDREGTEKSGKGIHWIILGSLVGVVVIIAIVVVVVRRRRVATKVKREARKEYLHFVRVETAGDQIVYSLVE